MNEQRHWRRIFFMSQVHRSRIYLIDSISLVARNALSLFRSKKQMGLISKERECFVARCYCLFSSRYRFISFRIEIIRSQWFPSLWCERRSNASRDHPCSGRDKSELRYARVLSAFGLYAAHVICKFTSGQKRCALSVRVTHCQRLSDGFILSSIREQWFLSLFELRGRCEKSRRRSTNLRGRGTRKFRNGMQLSCADFTASLIKELPRGFDLLKSKVVLLLKTKKIKECNSPR